RRLLELLLDSGHECWIDGYVLSEARRNLAQKAEAASATLESLLPRMHVAAFLVADPALATTLPLPEKDKPVLASAIRHRCDALVTGDSTHFGPLYGKEVHGVAVHSPRSLAELLLLKRS